MPSSFSPGHRDRGKILTKSGPKFFLEASCLHQNLDQTKLSLRLSCLKLLCECQGERGLASLVLYG